MAWVMTGLGISVTGKIELSVMLTVMGDMEDTEDTPVVMVASSAVKGAHCFMIEYKA